MKIKIECSDPLSKKSELLCGFVLERSSKILGLDKINSKIIPLIKQSINDIKGEFDKILIIPTNNQLPVKRILIAGIGKKEKLTNDTIRFISGRFAQKANELKLKEFSIITPPSSVIEPSSSASQIIEGCKMSLYKFQKYKSKKDGGFKIHQRS